jgi:hypothetical protein
MTAVIYILAPACYRPHNRHGRIRVPDPGPPATTMDTKGQEGPELLTNRHGWTRMSDPGPPATTMDTKDQEGPEFLTNRHGRIRVSDPVPPATTMDTQNPELPGGSQKTTGDSGRSCTVS